MWFKEVYDKLVKRHQKCINYAGEYFEKVRKEMTLRQKILALTFDVVRRTICGATRSLLQTLIFELLASNFPHLFLNNTKRICEHLNEISHMVLIQRKMSTK